MFLTVCLALFQALTSKADPLVVLNDGTQLQGKTEESTTYFKGIPFADPPIDDLRWKPPQKWKNPDTSQVIDATKHGHTCIQFLWGDDHAFDEGSEDCLVLNVFVNLNVSQSVEGPLPVAVFVHGGAYISGVSHLPLYDGVDMVEYWKGRAIVVTTNYRLNVFGFLGSEELRQQDGESGSTGNYGIQDQRMALEWVRDNIGSFGGDANRVTIFGESAGAMSMSAHLTTTPSWGLFSGVIMESGAFSEGTVISMECAEDNYAALLKNTGCATLQCLLEMDAKTISRASERNYLHTLAVGCPYAPVVDGVEFQTHPWILLANGDVPDVPIMLGSNQDEGAMFTVLPFDATEDQLLQLWRASGYSDEEIATLQEFYLTGTNATSSYDLDFASQYWWAAERTWTDDIMACPSEYTAQMLAQIPGRSSSTFLYHWEHTPRSATVARHVSEIPFAFHQNELLRHPQDAEMADVMCSYWGNFISSADPNSAAVGMPKVPEWTKYAAPSDPGGDNVVIIKDANDVSMTTALKQKECGSFYIPRIDASVRSKFPAA